MWVSGIRPYTEPPPFPEQSRLLEEAIAAPTASPVNLRYHLLDLSTIPPQRIAERTRARVHMGMIIMKYALQHRLKDRDNQCIAANVYTEQEERRMKTIADALQEEGLVKGIERGKADVLVRQLGRRFGITPEEEAIVRDCHDPDRLDAAAEAFADATAGKDEILALLK
jgi:hypothetical protein